ncbi:unnamed protein product [Absidia cylindrospora]
MSHLVYARGISLVANGVFSGLGLTMNLVNVPCIKASNDPLPVFTTTYNRASKIGISTIVLSSLAHFYIYYKTRNQRALWCGILSAVSFPYTVLILRPINDELFSLARSKSTDYVRINQLVSAWDNRQWFRTITGGLAFLLNVFYY